MLQALWIYDESGLIPVQDIHDIPDRRERDFTGNLPVKRKVVKDDAGPLHFLDDLLVRE